MIKKAIIGSLALMLIAGFVLGRDAKSYIRTMGNNVREAVKSEIDLDFEVERARDMIEDLVPAIEECQEVVIKQQVELARMEVSVAKQEDVLDSRKDEILALNADLTSGKDNFVYARINYSRKDVERDLRIRMDRYKGAEAALNRDKKIMMAQRDKLRANQQTLEGMVGQKKELEVAVAQLEARLEQLQAEEAISTLAIDDSQLSQAKQLVQELNEQMDVREAMIDAEGNFTGLIPVGQETEERDIASEVNDYFSTTTSKKVEKTDSEVLDPAA